MRVAIYARVSSERQVEKDLSIPAQLKALRSYAMNREWDVVAEYMDEAESARSVNRPAFKEMITAAKNKVKPFDAILVWKLSRFARNREDSVIYKSLLKRRLISVISINEQVDESPAGSLLEGIIEVIDEFYSANLSQDTMRGMKENALRGFRNGGRTPFGYRRHAETSGATTKHKITPDEKEAPIVTRIFEMAFHGDGGKAIADSLNAEGLRTRSGRLFGATNVNHILRNEAYVGTLVWNKRRGRLAGRQQRTEGEVIRVPDCHPPLVDRYVFERVQALLTSRRPSMKHPMRVSSQYLLSGLARCASCGSTAVGTNGKSGKYLYYSCNNRILKGRTACDAPATNARKLEAFVVDRIRENILTKENLEQLVRLTNEELNVDRRRSERELKSLEQESQSVGQKLANLYAVVESGKADIDDLAPRLKELRAQQRDLSSRKDEVLEHNSLMGYQPLDAAAMVKTVSDLQDLLGNASFLESKAFLASFVRTVEYDRKSVCIEYTMPIALGQELTDKHEVPVVGSVGSPSRIRTYDLAVNSRPLYR